MKDIQKGQQVEDNQSSQSNKTGDSQPKTINPIQPSLQDDEDATDNLREHQEQDHLHNYKTPVGEQNQQDENSDRGKSENTNQNSIDRNQNSNSESRQDR